MRYRVSGSLQGETVSFFVNRSTETGSYALDESFTRREATCLQRLLESRNLECSVREIPAADSSGRKASWDLIGLLVDLECSGAGRLSFPVVGCLEG